MTDCGATVSAVDPAVFYWYSTEHGLQGLLASHVDDFIWAGNDTFESKVIDKIRRLLSVGQEESDSFKYVGLNIQSQGSTIQVDQEQYLNNIQPIVISKKRATQKGSELNFSEKKPCIQGLDRFFGLQIKQDQTFSLLLVCWQLP
ncbi:hypothetical protein HOLleu_28750 [Holothuria leucospilota]|uniref:Reverse transcriptase Ty1/copia-type domain-containing protein n=1 Tax=Holothuria leucospilota TaxID=206669 RepID=A0A9Q1BMF9_HOLLE|nr:hypothetical protein HOLleu_28750 [Holothuria leucospilota]